MHNLCGVLVSGGCGENGIQDSSDDSTDVDDESFRPCSSESYISNGTVDKKTEDSQEICSCLFC